MDDSQNKETVRSARLACGFVCVRPDSVAEKDCGMHRWLSILLLAGPACWIIGTAYSQDSANEIIYSRHRHFRIPFQAGPGANRLKQLQLFVSTDQGKSWQLSASAPPEQGSFRFMSDDDGYYWFAVQTLDNEGHLYPASLDATPPSLRVVVDTLPPVVTAQALPPQDGRIGVSWEVRDRNVDLTLPDAVRVEYRPVGSVTWLEVRRSTASDRVHWDPQTTSVLEVRVRARDRAGNWSDATTTVHPGVNYPDPQMTSAPSAMQFGSVERRLVNSKRVNLNYELKDVGPSGVAELELWYTQDGRSWNKYPQRSSENPEGGKIAFDVAGEGVYGLTLVAKSGVGLSVQPPKIGDHPQIWLEVDMTRPQVQLQSVIVGRGTEKGKLTIHWSAQDKNLHPQPITLAYADNVEGPWTSMVQNQTNTGRYVWQMPDGVPYQFYVRVQATDQAGNIGEAVTTDMVRVDLSQPKVRIINVNPTSH